MRASPHIGIRRPRGRLPGADVPARRGRQGRRGDGADVVPARRGPQREGELQRAGHHPARWARRRAQGPEEGDEVLHCRGQPGARGGCGQLGEDLLW